MNDFDKLHKAIKKGDTAKIKQFIELGANINELDQKTGKFLLQVAMENQNLQAFDLLMSCKQINCQISNKNGETPLQIAVLLNNRQFVNKLLKKYLNPRKKNADGQTVLHVALINQTHQEILKDLVLYNFDINEKVDHYGSLLNLTIYVNKSDNFMFLVNQPTIKINILDSDGNNCLMLAVIHNEAQIVLQVLKKLKSQILSDIQKQFFINNQNKDGNTALHLAVLKNLQTIAQLIEKQGQYFAIDRSIRNSKNQTVDDIIALRQKNIELQKIAEQKKHQDKRIRRKEKQQQKQRLRIEEFNRAIEQKKKKKEQQMLQMQEKQQKIKESKNKILFIGLIVIIAILGIMYLAILNSIQKKKQANPL